jgi:hypothetical protein
MRRGRVLAALAAAAVAVTGVAVTLPASAAAAPVINVFSHNQSQVRVNVDAEAGVAGMTGQVLDDETGQQVATLDDFTLVSGDATDGLWESEKVQLPEFDVYRVEVTVTDTAGAATVGTGPLGYLIQPEFDQLRLNRTTVTYANRKVTVRGRLLGRWPYTEEVRPLAGFPVDVLARYDGTSTRVTTKADGTFAATVTFGDSVESVLVAYPDNSVLRPEYNRTEERELYVTAQPAPTRLSLAVDRARVRLGGSVTATGKLTRNLGSGYVAVPGAPVDAAWCTSDTACTPVGSVTTDAAGGYSVTTAPPASGWFQLTHTPSGPFLGSALKTSRLVTVLP